MRLWTGMLLLVGLLPDTALTDQEITDAVAYLAALRGK